MLAAQATAMKYIGLLLWIGYNKLDKKHLAMV